MIFRPTEELSEKDAAILNLKLKEEFPQKKQFLIEELIEAADCHLKYLPSYSPDLNKIERCWSWLKSRIRKQIDKFACLRDEMEEFLRGG